MGHYLFDDPTVGVVVAVVVEAILLVGWIFTRNRRGLYKLLAGPVIAGAFLLADRAVQTDREQLESVTRQVVQAAADEDAALIISRLSERFQMGRRMDKRAISQELRKRLSRPVIATNRIRQLKVTRAEEAAGEVEFDAVTRMDPSHPHAAALPIVLSSWRFEYVRDSDGQYRISNLKMLKLNNNRGIDIFSHRW